VRERRGAGVIGVILSAEILTWGTVLVVDGTQERNMLVDRAYRLQFA